MIVCTFNVIQISNFKTTRVYCHFKRLLHKGLNHCNCESLKTHFVFIILRFWIFIIYLVGSSSRVPRFYFYLVIFKGWFKCMMVQDSHRKALFRHLHHVFQWSCFSMPNVIFRPLVMHNKIIFCHSQHLRRPISVVLSILIITETYARKIVGKKHPHW